MVRGFSLKVFGKFEMRTIQPKISDIPRGKSNGTEIPGNNFPSSLKLNFGKFLKTMYH